MVSVYVFSLLVNYAHSGVDVAQGVRNEFLKNGNHEVKYFFFDVPGEREFSIYEREGIRKEQMLVLQYPMRMKKYHLSWNSQERIEIKCQVMAL